METKASFSYPMGVVEVIWEGEQLASLSFRNSSYPKRLPEFGFQLHHIKQLQEYFAGKRRAFDIDFLWRGTDFELSVWKATEKIPFGKVCSYADIARAIGKPQAARAVGGALGRNPLPIIVPCHRVLSSNGKLTGFGGGIDIKAYLLDLEGSLDTAGLSASKKRRALSFHSAA